MAHLTGVKGKVEVGPVTQTEILGVTNWTVDTEGDVVETTDYQADGVKEFIAGNVGWSGSFDVNYDTAQDMTTDPPKLIEGEEVIVKLYLDDAAARKLQGSAVITGISITVPQADKITYTVTFQGTGVLSKDFAGS